MLLFFQILVISPSMKVLSVAFDVFFGIFFTFFIFANGCNNGYPLKIVKVICQNPKPEYVSKNNFFESIFL